MFVGYGIFKLKISRAGIAREKLKSHPLSLVIINSFGLVNNNFNKAFEKISILAVLARAEIWIINPYFLKEGRWLFKIFFF